MYFFHQNMRVFGGGAPLRNGDYLGQFALVRQMIGNGQFAACGFTEVMNSGAARVALGGGNPSLCGSLGVNLVTLAMCGQMTLGQREWIGIGINPAANILGVGRVLFHAGGNSLQVFRDEAPNPVTPQWENDIPEAASLDYRGVVYVVFTVAGQTWCVGFAHNMYTFEAQRVLCMQKIPEIGQLIRSDSRVNGQALCLLGGDFNSPPMQRRSRNAGTWYPYAMAAGNGGTTCYGSLYDYWFTDVPPLAGFLQPGVFVGTQDACAWHPQPRTMSDHVGILAEV